MNGFIGHKRVQPHNTLLHTCTRGIILRVSYARTPVICSAGQRRTNALIRETLRSPFPTPTQRSSKRQTPVTREREREKERARKQRSHTKDTQHQHPLPAPSFQPPETRKSSYLKHRASAGVQIFLLWTGSMVQANLTEVYTMYDDAGLLQKGICLGGGVALQCAYSVNSVNGGNAVLFLSRNTIKKKPISHRQRERRGPTFSHGKMGQISSMEAHLFA